MISLTTVVPLSWYQPLTSLDLLMENSSFYSTRKASINVVFYYLFPKLSQTVHVIFVLSFLFSKSGNSNFNMTWYVNLYKMYRMCNKLLVVTHFMCATQSRHCLYFCHIDRKLLTFLLKIVDKIWNKYIFYNRILNYMLILSWEWIFRTKLNSW